MESCDGGAVEWEGSNDEPTLRVDQTRRIMRDTILGLEYRKQAYFAESSLRH